ncbi:MAG: outer membrane beta-barrel protein, partial [Bdellovibrionales bacterium]
KFYTHMGYEVTKAKDNWQYSRSYTFNYAIPFWHEGISANYVVVPGKFGTSLYLLNAWDGRISQESNKSSTVGANFNFIPVDGLVANYNYIGGIETSATDAVREVHEVNVAYNLNSMFSFATDLVFGSQKKVGTVDARWSGVAFYAKAALNDWYILSPRYETFDDSDQGFAISGGLAGPSISTSLRCLNCSSSSGIIDFTTNPLLDTGKTSDELESFCEPSCAIATEPLKTIDAIKSDFIFISPFF